VFRRTSSEISASQAKEAARILAALDGLCAVATPIRLDDVEAADNLQPCRWQEGGRLRIRAPKRSVGHAPPESPAHRLPAAFFLVGRPVGWRMRTCLRKLSPVSRSRRECCSGHPSVSGVRERLKGRWGPTIFLAEEPKNRDPHRRCAVAPGRDPLTRSITPARRHRPSNLGDDVHAELHDPAPPRCRAGGDAASCRLP
jgi:hypothetical protein